MTVHQTIHLASDLSRAARPTASHAIISVMPPNGVA